jgi:curved DNA-binding protein CbpA
VKSKVCINPDCAKKPEQAGWAFSKLEVKAWRAKMKEQIKAGNDKDADGNKIELSDSEDEEEIIVLDKADEKWVPTRTREEFIKCGVEGDLYGILDLVPFTLPFYSDEEIEKQYKRQSVSFHPDKNGNKKTEKDKKLWLNIKTARTTLMDLSKRRRYDSTLEFDDSIPSAKDIKSDDDFYIKFGVCFLRNSRFAEVRPAPELGNKDTPIEEVRAFYSYWDFFKSWREFTQFDEHDPTKAQDRYEKRWMEKQNKAERDKHAKAERKRLLKLVETAYELDPRIQAVIRKEKEEKEALKKSKQDLKQKKYREEEA